MRYFIAGFLTLFMHPAYAQSVYNGACEGQFSGASMSGRLLVQYLTYSDTYSYNGTFYTSDGTRYDFEVISNQNGGVGGAWVNGARHREAHIEMRYSGRTFVIRDTDNGGSGRFVCE